MVGIIDYEAGNLKSVALALRSIGVDYIVSRDREELLKSKRIIFPGVGEARSAMEALERGNLKDTVRELALSDRPFLGICLGFQILFTHSEENDTDMLGILPGVVQRFDKSRGLKIPHMGWNRVNFPPRAGISRLFTDITPGSAFYFVHSYFVKPEDKAIISATTDYGEDFTIAVERRNIMGVQFHPERSGEAGLKLLRNFVSL